MQSSDTTEIASSATPVQINPQRPYAGKRKIFIAIVCAQLLAIVAFGAPKAYALFQGTEVTLQAQPVDPYDLFRGEYARLSFADISRIPTTATFKYGDHVYTLLQKGPDHWRALSISSKMPKTVSGQVAIAGFVTQSSEGETRVQYGIDRLYMPEGKSRTLERDAKNVKAIVAVDQFGNACIKRINQNGHVIFDAMSMFSL